MRSAMASIPPEAKQEAAADPTAAARERALAIPIDRPLPLERIAEAHDRVVHGSRARVLLSTSTPPIEA